jgi:hypothetical protein
MALSPYLTLGPVALRYRCQVWQIRRLFERGFLPPAARVGAYRVISVEDLPQVEQALREAGYLKDDPAGEPSHVLASSMEDNSNSKDDACAVVSNSRSGRTA